jgi:hypothetical protein
MIDLYSFIPMLQHDLNLTRDIMAGNFLHDQQTRYKIRSFLVDSPKQFFSYFSKPNHKKPHQKKKKKISSISLAK